MGRDREKLFLENGWLRKFVTLWFTGFKCIALTGNGFGFVGGCCPTVMVICCMTDGPCRLFEADERHRFSAQRK